MPEVYTCHECKGQEWVIYGGTIQCVKCKKEYKVYCHGKLQSPWEFNHNPKEPVIDEK
jgi:hypothetical protein